MPRLHLVASLSVLALSACASAPRNSDPTAKIPVPVMATNAIQTTIAAVSERDGETLAEIPIGSADDIEAGTLLRVYNTEVGDLRLLKGMLQVTEVLGEHRAIARGIGLTDRANPLKVGDVAKLTDLASSLTDYRAQLANDTKKRQAESSNEDATFTRLRDQYQAELAAAQARFDQQLASEQSSHDQAIAELTKLHQQSEQLKEAEYKADRATLSASIREQTDASIAADRAERDQKLRDTQAENQRLTAHTERVVLDFKQSQAALAKTQADLTAKEANHAKALRMEVETRQVLQSRLAELEKRLNGKSVSSVAVLSNDPARGETVLAQLERLTGELVAARSEQERLAKELAEAVTARDAAQRDFEAISGQAAVGATDKPAGPKLITAAQASKLERAKLEAERQLYDLAGRVLALDGKPDSVAELQHRLQQMIAATTGENP